MSRNQRATGNSVEPSKNLTAPVSTPEVTDFPSGDRFAKATDY
jgi:hypothetical protein